MAKTSLYEGLKRGLRNAKEYTDKVGSQLSESIVEISDGIGFAKLHDIVNGSTEYWNTITGKLTGNRITAPDGGGFVTLRGERGVHNIFENHRYLVVVKNDTEISVNLTIRNMPQSTWGNVAYAISENGVHKTVIQPLTDSFLGISFSNGTKGLDLTIYVYDVTNMSEDNIETLKTLPFESFKVSDTVINVKNISTEAKIDNAVKRSEESLELSTNNNNDIKKIGLFASDDFVNGSVAVWNTSTGIFDGNNIKVNGKGFVSLRNKGSFNLFAGRHYYIYADCKNNSNNASVKNLVGSSWGNVDVSINGTGIYKFLITPSEDSFLAISFGSGNPTIDTTIYAYDVTSIYEKISQNPYMVEQLGNGAVMSFIDITNIAEKSDKPKENANDYALIAYGDSLTQGAGSSDYLHTYLAQCKTALGAKNESHFGYGGSSSKAIAFTAGALTAYIPPNTRNFALKYADMSSDVSIALNQMNGKVVIVDENEYTITQNGLNSYSLPTTYNPSNLWIPVTVKNSRYTADIYVIWVGTNDSGMQWDIIDAMISKLPHKNYVVMGLTRLGTDTSVEDELRAYQKYGSHYFNTRLNIINNAFNVLGASPTSEDTTAMNNGLMPPSLLVDNVHFNDSGYLAIGRLLAKHIKSLGYEYQR